MDEICRLCLTMSMEMACKLTEECKILHKLSSWNIQININSFLPSYVCYKCVKTLEDIENFREKVKRNEYKLKQHLNNKNLDNFYQRVKNYNISVENVKIEQENEDEVSYCNELFYFEPVDEKTEVIIENPETNEDVKQITLRTTDENNISNTILAEPENIKSKRKNNRQSIGQKPIKTKRRIKSNAKGHSKDLQNLKANQINILANTSETNTSNLEPANESKIEFIEVNAIENSKEIQNVEESVNNILDNISEPNITKLEPAIISKTELIDKQNSIESKNGAVEMEPQDQQCLTCFKYLSLPELKKHYKTVHYNKSAQKKSRVTKNKKGIVTIKPDRPYNCKICGRSFPTVYAIVRHGVAHGGAPRRYCSTGCGYSTAYKYSLQIHERKHQTDFKYKCATCGAGFHFQSWHDQHQNIHKNVKPYKCNVCGAAFHMHKYLTFHRRAVHVSRYISKGVSWYFCPHCDFAFHNTNNFRVHSEPQLKKTSFLCDLCGKMCLNRQHLQFHKNTHVGVKPYTCSICNNKFARKYNLDMHQRVHSGEKHLCQVCGKSFTQRTTLLRHHTNRHPDITDDRRKPKNRTIKSEF